MQLGRLVEGVRKSGGNGEVLQTSGCVPSNGGMEAGSGEGGRGGERKRWQGGRKPIGERKKTIFFMIII